MLVLWRRSGDAKSTAEVGICRHRLAKDEIVLQGQRVKPINFLAPVIDAIKFDDIQYIKSRLVFARVLFLGIVFCERNDRLWH